MSNCSECQGPHYARGLCSKHYQAQRREASRIVQDAATQTVREYTPAEVRQWASDIKTDTGGDRKAWRYDQYANPMTALGTSRDKAMQAAYFWNGPIPDPELTALYWNNDLAAKIIEKKPKAAFRAGYMLQGDDGGEIQKAANQKLIETAYLEGINLARGFGGSILWVGVADGLNPWEETDLDEAEGFNFLIPMDRRYVHVNRYYTDPNDPKYGQPMMYMVGDPTTAMVALIHETRVIRFDGVKVDRRLRQILRGWGLSVLQRPYEVLSDFGQSFQAVTNLLIDANQGVFKMKDLYTQLAEDPVALQQRMGKLDMMRSAGRSVLVDTEEEFERVTTSFGGLGQVLSTMMLRCASAADMPVTMLFGRLMAGLSDTGQTDLDQWYDEVREAQETYTDTFTQLLRIVARSIGKDASKLSLIWKNPDQPGKKEEAETEYLIAQRDAIYLDRSVWLPEEVAISRAQGKDTIEQTIIDQGARKTSLTVSLGELKSGELTGQQANGPQTEQGNETTEGKSPAPEAVGNLSGNAVQGQGVSASEKSGESQQTKPPPFAVAKKKKPAGGPSGTGKEGGGGSY